MRVAVSGASGFVGRHICSALAKEGWDASILDRKILNSSDIQLSSLLRDCDWIVNCAGAKSVSNARDRYVNEQLPRRLADMAISAGCKGLVHVSSVSALGSVTKPGAPLGDQDKPAPESSYGRSKLLGDQSLLRASSPGFNLIVLRPPLLYGSDARGLFGAFAAAARRGIPLPLRGHSNQRDMMHVDNFATAVLTAMRANVTGCYLVGDGTTFSPGELYKAMLSFNGFQDRTFSITRLGRLGLKSLLGSRADSLYSDSCYEYSRFVNDTNYRPHLSPMDALKDAALNVF